MRRASLSTRMRSLSVSPRHCVIPIWPETQVYAAARPKPLHTWGLARVVPRSAEHCENSYVHWLMQHLCVDSYKCAVRGLSRLGRLTGGRGPRQDADGCALEHESSDSRRTAHRHSGEDEESQPMEETVLSPRGRVATEGLSAVSLFAVGGTATANIMTSEFDIGYTLAPLRAKMHLRARGSSSPSAREPEASDSSQRDARRGAGPGPYLRLSS